ncbi:MAG: STAS domain-containing protein, partial [Bacillota bacterium]
MAHGATAAPALALQGEGDARRLEGVLDIRTLHELENSLPSWLKGRKSRTLDLATLESLDTPGALLLCGLREKGVELKGMRKEHAALLDLI